MDELEQVFRKFDERAASRARPAQSGEKRIKSPA